MQRKLLLLKIVFGIFTNWLLASPIAAQITPDGSLPTRVEQQGNDFTIEDGAREGNNLFHSFGDFSVPDGGSATFNNAPDVVNILNRVTGGNISQIEGSIRANGAANLFLINPAGIIFSENARLDIGGSFYGSTADSILFPNGIEFSATNPQSPTLTVNAPIGLNLRPDSGEIVNRSVASDEPDEFGFANVFGLAVNEGRSITFEANKITLLGGLLTAPGGSITLNALEDITITGNSNTSSFSVDTSSDINNGGRIEINATNGAIKITDSDISSSNTNFDFLSFGDAGGINIFARESLVLENSILSAISNNEGIGGDVALKSETSIELINTRIDTGAFGNGRSGDINIEALNQGFISFIGTQEEPTQIFTDAFGSGEELPDNQTGGNLTIIGGDISINNYDFISIVNEFDEFLNPNTQGNGGDISIRGNQISILNNSLLETQTSGEGAAGDINIISDSLSLNNSQIEASNRTPENAIEDSVGGNINIQLNDRLVLRNDSSIVAEGENNADAGKIDIDSQFVIAFPSSGDGNDIITRAEAGEGGTIDITTESIINLENRTSINNNATNDLDARSGTGIDGNVFVNTILVNEIEQAADLSLDLVNIERQIAYVCQTKENSSELVIKGTGSLGNDPAAPFISEDIYIKNKPVNLLETHDSRVNNSSESIDFVETSNGKIIVAKGAVIGKNGQVQLVAYSTYNNDKKDINWQNCLSYLP